ncbi:MAG: hypothetical protein Q4A07_01875 [Coriobacteriales bacterium]|nr:hypothetical protein [Coriobacteriales bacterium]
MKRILHGMVAATLLRAISGVALSFSLNPQEEVRTIYLYIDAIQGYA